MSLKDIIVGHTNELLGREEQMSNKRLELCRKCPLFVSSLAGIRCNSNMWMNPKTQELSDNWKEGFVNGCGCRLEAKTRTPLQKDDNGNLIDGCPASYWNRIDKEDMFRDISEEALEQAKKDLDLDKDKVELSYLMEMIEKYGQ